MAAFVPNTGLSAVSRTVLPQSGLQTVCARPCVPVTNSPNTASSTPRMLLTPVNQSITLQTLTYNPTPVVSGIEDKDLICYRVWRQVFGNAYVMESEREDAYVAESSYRAGTIPLREFVRAVALSDTYKRRFFDCCGPYRAVELNFKHLLSRGPISQEEVSKHIQIIANEGFEAEINSYIDSAEYEEAFGSDYVPYMRFKGTYPSMSEFTRMCTIYSAAGTSDKSLTKRARNLGIDNPNHVLSLDGAGYASTLVSNIAMEGKPSFVSIKRALPLRPDLELAQDNSANLIDTSSVVNPAAKPRTRVEITAGNYMYLDSDELAAMQAEKNQADMIVSLAEGEIANAQAQIKELQEKIAALSAIV